MKQTPSARRRRGSERDERCPISEMQSLRRRGKRAGRNALITYHITVTSHSCIERGATCLSKQMLLKFCLRNQPATQQSIDLMGGGMCCDNRRPTTTTTTAWHLFYDISRSFQQKSNKNTLFSTNSFSHQARTRARRKTHVAINHTQTPLIFFGRKGSLSFTTGRADPPPRAGGRSGERWSGRSTWTGPPRGPPS